MSPAQDAMNYINPSVLKFDNSQWRACI